MWAWLKDVVVALLGYLIGRKRADEQAARYYAETRRQMDEVARHDDPYLARQRLRERDPSSR